MAQRLIHYLFGELLSRQEPLRDRNRFLLGSVLPDAFADRGDRSRTHFVDRSLPGQRFYNFGAFREQFGEGMARDDLYLGYYMHLVEDNFYRQLMYGRYNAGRAYKSQEGVARLHRDYHLLNAHIVKTYGLSYELRLPPDFGQEPIHAIASFDAEAFLREMEEDFVENQEGSTCFITEAMLDDFVKEFVPLALAELRHAIKGETYLKAEDFRWIIQ